MEITDGSLTLHLKGLLVMGGLQYIQRYIAFSFEGGTCKFPSI